MLSFKKIQKSLNCEKAQEVVLVTYNSNKTTYELLVRYSFLNIDPFNEEGQFCARGKSYSPAIFYDTTEEFIVAKNVLAEILAQNPDWSEEDIVVSFLLRSEFRKGRIVRGSESFVTTLGFDFFLPNIELRTKQIVNKSFAFKCSIL